MSANDSETSSLSPGHEDLLNKAQTENNIDGQIKANELELSNYRSALIRWTDVANNPRTSEEKKARALGYIEGIHQEIQKLETEIARLKQSR